ncbi:MAG: hypothetical protein IBX43_03210 [Campylobacterales bacterium]|nr:hypothetical protein [Campylobacterales bacterium]
MKYFLHILLALFIASFLTACYDEETFQVDSNLTSYANEKVDIHAPGALSYSWRQVSGISVVLINQNRATLSFIAPDVTAQEILVFELEAITQKTQSRNMTLKGQVNVTVLPERQKEKDANNTNRSRKSLKLTLEKTSLALDTNTTLKVVANYNKNICKDVTAEVEWILSDTDAVTITNTTLHAKKETNILIQAKCKNQTSNTLALEIYKEINGHKLPPEPNMTVNNATLLGIDSNDNGVRDDVERWIFAEYDEPIVQAVAMQNARAFQIILEDPSNARETKKFTEAQLDCQSYYMYQDERKLIPRGTNLHKESRPRMLNTRERSRAYYEFNQALSGGVYPARDRSKYKESCDFNKTKILNGEWE